MALLDSTKGPFDINKTCRGCSSQDKDVRSLFTTVSDTHNMMLNEVLMDFSGMKIYPEADLPEKLCTACIALTELAYSFKRQVLVCDKSLRDYFNRQKKLLHDVPDNIPESIDPLKSDFELKDADFPPLNLCSGNSPDSSSAPFEGCDRMSTECQTNSILCPSGTKICRKIKPYKRVDRPTAPSHPKIVKSLAELLSKKMYHCNTCDKIFNSQDNLLEHKAYCISEIMEPIKEEESVWTNEIINSDTRDDPQDCQIYSLSPSETRAEISTPPNSIKNSFDTISNHSPFETNPDVSNLQSCNKPSLEIVEEVSNTKKCCKKLLELNDDVLAVKKCCKKTFETNVDTTNLQSCKESSFIDKGFPINLSVDQSDINMKIEIDEDFGDDLFLYPRLSSRIRAKRDKTKFKAKFNHSKGKKDEIKPCDVCGAEFKNADALKLHCEMHIGRSEIECVFCSMAFEDKLQLFEHVKMHDVGKPYTCNFCSASFTKGQSLQTHVRIKHTKERAFPCPLCPKTFVEKRALNRHKIAHRKQLSCHICNMTFGYRNALTAHLRLHMPSLNTIPCPQCEQVFKDDFQLKRHKRLAHTGETHSCPSCSKVFSHVSRLRRHLLVHRGVEQRRLQCQFCSRRFNHTHHLASHERTHTGVKPYLCAKCGKGFTQSVHLTIHLRQHENVPFSCELCGYTSLRKNSLESHMKTHSEIHQYSCSVCDQKFPSESKLQKHMTLRNHHNSPIIIEFSETGNKGNGFQVPTPFTEIISGNTEKKSIIIQRKIKDKDLVTKPHLCSECEMSFKQKQQLKSHTLRAHSQERPFLCTLCPSKFSHSADLKVHLRRHTGENPYSCKFCDKAFPASTALKVHLRSHTLEKPFPCHVCNKSFSTSSTLSTHMKTHPQEQAMKVKAVLTQPEELINDLQTQLAPNEYQPKIIDLSNIANLNLRDLLSTDNNVGILSSQAVNPSVIDTNQVTMLK